LNMRRRAETHPRHSLVEFRGHLAAELLESCDSLIDAVPIRCVQDINVGGPANATAQRRPGNG
jgi:hypothetical protein